MAAVQVKQPYKNPQVRYEGTFGRLDFPDYQYREFPKWARKGGKEQLVYSKKEELDFLTNTPADSGNLTPEALHPLQAENQDLAQAVADKDAEIAKLREQLAKTAGMDSASQPVKSVASTPPQAPATVIKK
jgi:hypothetical protein